MAANAYSKSTLRQYGRCRRVSQEAKHIDSKIEMISKKLVWRTAAKFDGEFSITELIDELSKEVSRSEVLGERYYYKYEDILNVVSFENVVFH